MNSDEKRGEHRSAAQRAAPISPSRFVRAQRAVANVLRHWRAIAERDARAMLQRRPEIAEALADAMLGMAQRTRAGEFSGQFAQACASARAREGPPEQAGRP